MQSFKSSILALAILALLLALLAWAAPMLWPYLDAPPAPGQRADVAAPSEQHAQALWQPWSAQRQAQWLEQGQPVFVDYTAAWCVTCQYNKRTTLSDPQVLQAFARTVQATVRNTDMLARWGGEEFVLMLYDSDAASALGLLERVRAKVQAMELPFDGRSVRVTVSMGVALSRPGEPLERLLERADVALYEAKSQGRNRVVLQDEATPGV